MSTIDVKGLTVLVTEANELSNKPQLNKQQQLRFAYLQSAIAAVRSGASLEEVTAQMHNERSRANGLPEFTPKAVSSTEREVRNAFKKDCETNFRDMSSGSIKPRITDGSYTGMGYFVPVDFYPNLFSAMAAHDGLFDEENVTLIKSANGRPLPVPVASDVEQVATLLSESYAASSVDIHYENAITLGAHSFSSPRFVFSLEILQDLEQSFTAVGLAKKFFADRIARGIGKYLVNGTGSSQPTGLLPGLANLGVTGVTAVGSSNNTGGSETGSNSLGSADFSAALSQLDDAYANSDRCRWALNKKTLATVAGLTDKMGRLLNLVNWNEDGSASILGIKTMICPSLPNIGSGNVPVVLGDYQFYATRLVTDETSGLLVYREAPGLIEQGNVGARCFVRSDGNILWHQDIDSPGGSTCPFVPIKNA